MMYLISAVPGSGKTLRIVGKIKAMIAENDKRVSRGEAPRLIYSNVKGLLISGVLPSPDDWRDTPQNSIVIYDEAQEIFPATGSSGISKDERVVAMTTHRHSGHDLYFLTQDPIFLDATLRKLVGHHEHLWRASSIQAATVYSWDVAKSSPMSATEHKTADVETWSFPKEDYALYSSASHHTHKFKMPRKILWLLIGLALVSGLTLWAVFGRENAFAAFRGAAVIGAASAGQAAGAAAGAVPSRLGGSVLPPTGAENWISAEKLPALAGCAVLSKSCRAWDMEGAQLDLPEGVCRALCTGPMPLDFSELKKREEAARVAAVAQVEKRTDDYVQFGPPPAASTPRIGDNVKGAGAL